MGKACVHEHVGDELGGVEAVGKYEVQSQVVAQVDAATLCHEGGQKHQHVDYQ